MAPVLCSSTAIPGKDNPSLHVFLAARALRARRKWRGTGLLITDDENTLHAIIMGLAKHVQENINPKKYYCNTSDWGESKSGEPRYYEGPVEINIGYRNRKPYLRIRFALRKAELTIRWQLFGNWMRGEDFELRLDLRDPLSLKQAQRMLVWYSIKELKYGLCGR